MTTFAELGVPTALTDVLDAEGKRAAFPIQEQTLPDTLAGRDVLGRGKTGSGKTLAFALPIAARLGNKQGRAKPGRPRALVLAPTRELATQIDAVIAPLAKAYGLTTTTIYGGVSQQRQEQAMRRGVDIVVACPGRLEDLMRQGVVHLDAVQITVLDDMPSIALTGGNLITDGDFAGGPGDFPLHVNEWQPGSGADTDGITGWTVTGSPVNTAGFVELERVGDGYLGMHTSTHGAMIDMAASPGNIAIAQTVTGTLGQTYAIQFEAGAPFPTTAQLQVYWGGQLIGTIDPTGPMTSYNYVVTANGGPQTLEFREVGDVTSPTPGAADGGYHGTYLANVAMIPVSIVDEDGLNPNGNHDLPTPSVGDAQVPDTDGDHNEATTTGALNITWGVDDTNGGVDGTAADSGFVQDGANAATLTGRSATWRKWPSLVRSHSTWSMKSKSICNERPPSGIGEVVKPHAVT